MSLKPLAVYWFTYIDTLFILFIRFQLIPGCFPFCSTNGHKPVELSRENESDRSIHLLFERNFDYAQQSRTENENFWLDRDDRSKRTIPGDVPLRPENFYADRSVPFISRPKLPNILTLEKHPLPHPKNTTVPASKVNFVCFSSLCLNNKKIIIFRRVNDIAWN